MTSAVSKMGMSSTDGAATMVSGLDLARASGLRPSVSTAKLRPRRRLLLSPMKILPDSGCDEEGPPRRAGW